MDFHKSKLKFIFAMPRIFAIFFIAAFLFGVIIIQDYFTESDSRVLAAGVDKIIAPGSLSQTSGYAVNPQRKLARTSNGSLHAVYSRSDGARFQIYHSYSIDNGETWTEESLTSETCGDQTNPAIAADSNNFLYVVWQCCNSDSPSHSQIRYRKYTSDWSEIVNITADADWDQRIPAIAVDGNDNVHTVWQKIEIIDNALCKIGCGPTYYSKYDKSADSWGAPLRIGEGEQYEEINPAIAIGKDNNVNVVWMSGGYRNGNCSSSVYRKYTDSWQYISESECSYKFPSVTVDSKDDVHLVASKLVVDQGVLVYSKNGWANPQEIVYTGYGSKLLSIATDSNDYLHVVWSNQEKTGSINHIQYTSSWQSQETLVSDTDSAFPSLIWAQYPEVNGIKTNILKTGYAFVWNDGPIVKFYKSADLEWGTPPLPPNQAPTAEAGGSYTIDEGSSVIIDGSGSTDPDNDPLTFAWDIDNDGTYEILGATTSITPPDGPATLTVGLQVSDGKDGVDTDTATVTVNNVNPITGPITSPIDPQLINGIVSVSSMFADAGILDTHTTVWDWGDSTISTGIALESGGSGTVTGNHTYNTPGVYTITLTVTDKDGGVGTAQSSYVVIVDPNGGFVTGGGWFNSPQGAYIANPTLIGRANFGFVSKYHKGATTPTGETEFQFKVADINFHSASYDWLVVAGSKAQYKGSGTINGAGNYGFLLAAIDEQITGGGDTDKFRIKIIDRNTDAIIYDNQLIADDNANPTTAISGGSIVIHKE